MKRIVGSGENDVPDVPLGRAWLRVLALSTERGAETVSRLQTASDEEITAASSGVVESAERVYGIPPDQFHGFINGMVHNVVTELLAGSADPQRLGMVLAGTLASTLLTGVQLERDRIAEKRREGDRG